MNMDREYAEFATAKAVQLLAIDSPTGFTAQAARWVKNEFEQLGFSAVLTQKGGVLVNLGGENAQGERSPAPYSTWRNARRERRM